jgi:putative transcriptional regulator
MTQKRFKSTVSEALHEFATGLYKVGAVNDDQMRDFDRTCLVMPPQTPEEIRALRTKACVSQSDFAYHLNVSPGLISQWERGEKRPSGPSLKLLDLVARKGLEALL